uniref:Uncharacterized protein n=1 Tax=Timema poppense TaxID=170557 RepID=A0A7R9H5B2_TIMPO|nr:unnamed protein product [Timema poppensis]
MKNKYCQQSDSDKTVYLSLSTYVSYIDCLFKIDSECILINRYIARIEYTVNSPFYDPGNSVPLENRALRYIIIKTRRNSQDNYLSDTGIESVWMEH